MRVVRGQNPATAENVVGPIFPAPTSLASIGSVRYRISVPGLDRRAGRSRLIRSIPPPFGMLRAAVVCPEGAGTDQPGAECSAAPGDGANGSGSPEGARQADASIVAPLQATP
jgi:hypothetical protein